jgi:hypothetical protein
MAKLSKQEIISKRVVKSTRSNYKSYVAKFTKWMIQKHPEMTQTVNEITSLKLPLANDEAIIDFLADAQFVPNNNQNQTNKLVAVSTMNGMRSAIIDLYKENKISLNESTTLLLKQFMSGYKRTVQEAKQKGELPVFEGKRNITYSGYKTLALQVLKRQQKADSSLYVHVFILLSWNLFARSNSIANLMLHHFDWKEDSLLITLPKHKGDQEGINVYPKHLYANPVYPELCPILSLAIYLFSTNQFSREGSDWNLFHGLKTESKFSHWLHNLLEQNIPELAELNSLKDEIGTHSFRKGVVTFVLSFPCGPSVIAAFLRACWSLGAVQQRYIFEGEGSDQFLGRVACGLPFGERDFQSLPPRFDSEFKIAAEDWKEIFPNYNQANLPAGFHQCLPYLLASIVYHVNWIENNLDKQHPIFKSPLWTSNFISKSKPYVLAGIKRCSKTNMIATGIPPMIDLTCDVKIIKDSFEWLFEVLAKSSNEIKGFFNGKLMRKSYINFNS